ncbi:MAG: SDR family NAD(P)-dependent oxidoreductase, partial [Planctomycetota bacterium]
MNDVALITGASAGIGTAIAREWARQQRGPLVLTARRAQALHQLAEELQSRHGCSCTVLPADLTEPSAPAALMQQLHERGLRCRWLINNAGFGRRGAFDTDARAAQLAMLQLNCGALTALSHLALPDLRASRGGICNVASTAAFQPGPWMSVYYATKAYVLSFSEGLRHELRGSGVAVSCCCPGPTHTEFAGTADMEETPMFRYAAMPADRVARAALRGLDRNRAIVIPGLGN